MPLPAPRASARAHGLGLAVLAAVWLLRPGAAAAQAEPAPPGSVPGATGSWVRREVQQQPRVRVAAGLRLSGLLGETGTVVPPLGWGFGLQLSASLLPLGPVRLGFVLDFTQDRFSREYAERPELPQLLVHNVFAVQLLADVPTRWVRPFLAAGPGMSLARHESPLRMGPDALTGVQPGVDVAVLPLVRLSAGLGISPLRWFEFGLGAELTLTFSDVSGGVVAQNEMLVPAMGHLFSPGLWSATTWVAYRFY